MNGVRTCKSTVEATLEVKHDGLIVDPVRPAKLDGVSSLSPVGVPPVEHALRIQPDPTKRTVRMVTPRVESLHTHRISVNR